MAFCGLCGKKTSEVELFCINCGCPVKPNLSSALSGSSVSGSKKDDTGTDSFKQYRGELNLNSLLSETIPAAPYDLRHIV